MSDFLNGFLKKILGDKKTWNAMEARAAALPKDYQAVYTGIKNYMFKFATGDGMDIIVILKDLLDLFEEGMANEQSALEITGDDVAAFCDELLRDANTYIEDWRTQLNSDIAKKRGKE
jgi:DNA-binding ferritin-like protein (Dps family)